MQTQHSKTQSSFPPAGGRVGRPAGSLAKIPPGHVDLNGLADLIGLSPTTIPNLEKRGDPRIPPRSPLAGFGAHRRAIWRVADVQARIESLYQAASAADPGAVTPDAVTANSAWNWGGWIEASQSAATATKRRPGRPRKTSK